MGTAVAPAQKKLNGLKDMLEKGKGQLQLAMAKHLDPDRMIRLALTAASKNPKLQDCTQASIGLALLTASQLGLEPNGRDAHLVPYGNECQLIPDYKGLVKLAFRNPRVKTFYAKVVYENDEFDVEFGTTPKIEHRPTFGERGALKAVYAVAKIDTADPQFVVMTKADVEKRKAMSKSANSNSSPWKLWTEEMWQKTAAKQLSKWLPLGDDFQSAVEHDNSVETLDVTFSEQPADEKPHTLDQLTDKLQDGPIDANGPATQDQLDMVQSLLDEKLWPKEREAEFMSNYPDLTEINVKDCIQLIADLKKA